MGILYDLMKKQELEKKYYESLGRAFGKGLRDGLTNIHTVKIAPDDTFQDKSKNNTFVIEVKTK